MKSVKVRVQLDKNQAQKELDALLKKENILNIDTSKFKASINDIVSELNKLKTSLGNINTNSFNGMSDGIKKAKNEASELKSELSSIASGNLMSTSVASDKYGNVTEVNKYRDSIAQTTAETIRNGEITKQVVSENIAQFEKLKSSMQSKLDIASSNGLVNASVIDSLQQKLNSLNTNTAEKEVNELKAAIANLSGSDSSIIKLQNSINSIQDKINNSRTKYKGLIDENDLKKTTAQVENLKKILNDITNGNSFSSSKITYEINNANSAFKNMETNARTSASALRTASQDSQSFSSAIQRAFSNSGIFLTTATAIRTVTNEIKNATSYIIELDERLSNIQMITGRSSSSVKEITDDFKNLGAELHTTNSELMSGAEEILRAGYDVDTAKKMMESSIIGAKISGQTTEAVTEQLIAIKNAFNLDGSAMGSVVDIISKMDNTSATSFAEIADAIQRTAYSAQQAGTPLENLVAYITTVSEKTRRSAETIGESFKSIYSRYSNIKLGNMDDEGKSINDVEKALARVDIKIRDSANSFREFDDVLKDYVSKYQQGLVSQTDHLAVVNTLAGTRQKETLLALIENFDAVTKHQNDMADSAGSAKQKFDDVYSESLKAKVDDLKRSFEALYESFLNSEVLGNSIDGFSTLINTMANVTNTLGAMPTILTAVTGAFVLFNAKARENAQILVSTIPGMNKWQSGLISVQEGLNKQIIALKENITQLKTNSVENSKAGISTKGLATELLGLNAKLALSTTAMIASKVALIALQAAASMALTLGISALISGVMKLGDTLITTSSEMKAMNDEFNSFADTDKSGQVSKLITQYKNLQKDLSKTTEGTKAYTDIESQLATIQEKIIELYPQASTVIDENTGKKSLNLQATEKLIGAELELAKAKADKSLEKNDIDDVGDVEYAIKQYEGYLDIVTKLNDMKAKGQSSRDINTNDAMSQTGKLNINVDDLDVYTKRLEEAKNKLETVNNATGILGATNEEWADANKKVSESLGLVSDNLALDSSSVDSAADSMNDLANATDNAATSIDDLTKVFSSFDEPIKLLKQATEEFLEYGMLSTDTYSDIIKSGNSELIALLSDNENFLSNAQGLLDKNTQAQEDYANSIINTAVQQVNGSQQVVDALGTEAQAYENLESTKSNTLNNSIMNRANAESDLVNSNLSNYNTDQKNHANKEDNKIKGSFASANARMQGEADTVNNNEKNYGIDDKNFNGLVNSKSIMNTDLVNGIIDSHSQMVTDNDANYRTDASNFTALVNSKIGSLRVWQQANNQMFLSSKDRFGMMKEDTLGLKKAMDEVNVELKEATNNYVGSGGIAGGVGHGDIGSGSSGNKGSSGSTEKEIDDLESLVDRYTDYNNAVTKVENALKALQIQQENASDEDRVKLIQKEIDLLNQKRTALQNLQAEQNRELNELKNSLSGSGFKFNGDGSISNINQQLEALRNSTNALSGSAKETAIANVKAVSEAVKRYNDLLLTTIPGTENSINDIKNTIIDAQKEIADVIKDEYEVWKDKEEKKTDKLKEEIQKRKDLMNKQWEQEDYQDKLDEEQSKLNQLQSARADAIRTGNTELIASLDKQIAEQQKAINDIIKENERDNANDKADELIDNLEKELQAKLDSMDEQMKDDVLLGKVQAGATSLSDIFGNINTASNDLNKNMLMVGDSISSWTTNLDTFISKMNSIQSGLTVNMNGVIDGNISKASAQPIIEINNTIEVKGGTCLTEDVLDDILEENNKTVIKQINDSFKR